ncbi:MAG: GNAT family acetyltransferase [Acidobacteriaceae bacterium]
MRSDSSLPADMVLREFQFPDDFTQVIELWKNAGSGIHLRRSDERDEITKKLQRDPDLFLVAEVAGKVIGSVLGGFDGRRGMVYHLAVEAEFRNRGIGAVLMAELESRMKQKGCIRSYLMVTHDNQEAIRFYHSLGWEQMDILTFGKDLA